MCDDDLTDGRESADPEMLQICDDGLMEGTVQILKCVLMGDQRFCLQYLKCNRFCV